MSCLARLDQVLWHMKSPGSNVQTIMSAFLNDDLWLLSWGASVQRVRIYADGAPARERTELSKCLHKLANELVEDQYGKAVVEVRHCENIQSPSNARTTSSGSSFSNADIPTRLLRRHLTST